MSILTIAVILAMLGALGALATGIGSMVHGGTFDQRHDVQLMTARIGLQGLAILLVFIAVYHALA